MHRTTLSYWPACAATFLLFAASFAHGQNFTLLHTFHCTDGDSPYAGVTLGTDGNLYGTTSSQGSNPQAEGTIFKITTSGEFTTIHNFIGPNDGRSPTSTPIQDAAGNLYGTTDNGGSVGLGVVWKITPDGHESIIHSFDRFTDGWIAPSDLVRDEQGNLYGVTSAGGDPACAGPFGLKGCGSVYKVDASGGLTVLHTFDGSPDDGSYAFGGLIRDSAGNLYGTNYADGLYEAGQVFKIDPSGNKTTVHDFDPGVNNDGAYPDADLTVGPNGVIYGVAGNGGDMSVCTGTGPGCGVVFQIDGDGILSTIYSFEGGHGDGSAPDGAVAFDAAGNLYGVTFTGGKDNKGTVYKLDTAGNETILHNFTGGKDGFAPHGRIYVTADGIVYGAAGQGRFGCGTIYKITPQ